MLEILDFDCECCTPHVLCSGRLPIGASQELATAGIKLFAAPYLGGGIYHPISAVLADSLASEGVPRTPGNCGCPICRPE